MSLNGNMKDTEDAGTSIEGLTLASLSSFGTIPVVIDRLTRYVIGLAGYFAPSLMNLAGIIYTGIVAVVAVLVSVLVYYIVSTMIKANQDRDNKDNDNVLFRQGSLDGSRNRPPLSYRDVVS